MTVAMVAGTEVWLAIAAGAFVWLVVLVLSTRPLFGPRQVVRWFLESWLSRLTVLTFWALAGWHIFCQRP
jgi:hypothetical protein